MFLFLFLKVKIFAPNAEQMHMVNHLKGGPIEERRNVREESAKRVCGDTRDLADLHLSKLDAVIIPGELAETVRPTVHFNQCSLTSKLCSQQGSVGSAAILNFLGQALGLQFSNFAGCENHSGSFQNSRGLCPSETSNIRFFGGGNRH